MHVHFALLAACAAAVAVPARAGVTVKTSGVSGSGSTVTIEGDKVRIEGQPRHGEDERQDVIIFDAATKTMTHLDPAKKTYSVTTEADMRKAGEQMRAQLDKAKAGMTPEQRKKLEALMSKEQAAADAAKQERDVAYQPTGERKTVAGYPCQVYRKVTDGKEREEACLVPWSAGVLKKEDLKPFIAFDSFTRAFMEGAGRPVPRRTGMVAKELERLPGFPAETIVIEPDGKRLETEKLVSMQRGPVSADRFQPPAGYTQVAAPILGGRQ